MPIYNPPIRINQGSNSSGLDLELLAQLMVNTYGGFLRDSEGNFIVLSNFSLEVLPDNLVTTTQGDAIIDTESNYIIHGTQP